MNEQFEILMIDDEIELQNLMVTYLSKEGYHVHTSTNAEKGIAYLQHTKSNVALVLLDIMLEDMNGFDACKTIRTFSHVPIIMLTARASEDDRIKGLKFGADDYVVKPFSPRELMARIEATLRRTGIFSHSKTTGYTVGNLHIDEEGRRILMNNETLNVTRKEFDLFLFLFKHKGQVFSREQLHDQIWGFDSEMGTLRTVDTHIKTLRLKLADQNHYIKTVWGVGYKFEE
ncbi:response regulator transcription factor [Alkalihalobacillus pseudalcaliphilus]|uniref:response regulator transcription factor n=1 Tax=Alkalihalobacillus pseudalcaliphilus TaxID=79884 RepID=UPI00064DCE20|nr:response regulator transcription factor [Alkalihalobacillus pseudalcaliphilus]KMK77741.1 transcriptional regulator [Alkalihalobacillus pseudalcaliphilus]